MRFAPLLLAAVTTVAQAQTLELKVQNEDELRIAPDDCASSAQVTWTVPSAYFCSDLELWLTASTSCADAPGTSDTALPLVAQSSLSSGSGNVTVAFDQLPFEGGDGGSGCDGAALEKTFLLCGAFEVGDQFSLCASPRTIKDSAPPKIVFDSLAPGAPTLTSVVPNDGALSVRVTAPADAITIVLFAKEEAQPDTAFAEVATFATSGGIGRITGLTNGVTYAIRAYAEDAVQNRSEGSAIVTGTPVASEGFYGTYQRLGGQDEGGCSAAGGGVAGALALLVLGTLWRSRRHP